MDTWSLSRQTCIAGQYGSFSFVGSSTYISLVTAMAPAGRTLQLCRPTLSTVCDDGILMNDLDEVHLDY